MADPIVIDPGTPFDDTVLGLRNDDLLAGGAGSDRVTGKRGDDVLVYDVELNEGFRDLYDGGIGYDTLRLEMTGDTWLDPDVQAEIAAYYAFLDDQTAGGTTDADKTFFTFSCFDLRVTRMENLEILVDGVPSDDWTPLPASFGFVLAGINAGDYAGISVSSAGDVNGDGIDDILIGGRYAAGTGEAYVIFGKNTGSEGDFTTSIDLASLGAGDGSTGFVLTGIDAGDFAGISVASAGDVNGDGIDDMVIGAHGADQSSAYDAGESYVVFGKDTAVTGDFAASIDLGSLDGTTGFVVTGLLYTDYSGWSVASAGDVNGDGIDDILIGAFGADQAGTFNAGGAYIVFGKDTAVEGDFAASMDLASLNGSNGFALTGIDAFDYTGYSVAAAGDINGDGIDDILIGSTSADRPGTLSSGETYVVFGKDTAVAGNFAASIDLASFAAGDGSTGFVLTGIDSYDYSGVSVAAAGDVNGDGFDDIVIGAYGGDTAGTQNVGETYVVFGKDTSVTGDFAASIDLANLDGSMGFVLTGVDAEDESGISVASAGDVNGDGIDDILIGGYRADQTTGVDAGESYLVFGKDTGFAASVDLASLNGADGFVFKGIGAGDYSGYSVAAAGDVNGDGIDDILIGAGQADTAAGADTGESYLVFGGTTLLAAFDAADGVSDGAIDLALIGTDPMAFV
ncbi:hypothetical protein [Fluviibacterium sp. S390]|uniref:hypothetical protein n=1 Tax=Fluviibacterium sp. S390 TaxID=3415139 RepID=UPI003C7E6DF2